MPMAVGGKEPLPYPNRQQQMQPRKEPTYAPPGMFEHRRSTHA